MSPDISVINDNMVVIEQKLDDISSALTNDRLVITGLINDIIENLDCSLIVIIIMLGIIAGACIFRHLRK